MFVLDTIAHRLRQGCQTMAWPNGPAPALPDRHGGALRLDASKCTEGCARCIEICPTRAIEKPHIPSPGAPVSDRLLPSERPKPVEDGTEPRTLSGESRDARPRRADRHSAESAFQAEPETSRLKLDLGKCIFCAACVEVCPNHAITQTGNHRMAVRRREDLILGKPGEEELRLATALGEKLRKLFGRSLRLRQVSAGGCNACEADTNVLGTIGWDLGRFGMQFVASPRHADGLLITGPVSRNMELALKKTYDAVPDPKIVIAVGACAINGGPFIGLPQVRNGANSAVPVDLYIPGCPPHPLTILDGLLRLLGHPLDQSL